MLMAGPSRLVDDNKLAILVHEFVHMHNNADGRRADVPEVYDLVGCVGLGVEESLGNAQSWAFYAASVWAGCIDYPRVGL